MLKFNENAWDSFLNSIKTIKIVIITLDLIAKFITYNKNSMN